MVRRVLDRATEKKKKVTTVFISTKNDLTEKVFKELEALIEREDRLRLYHLSAEDVLKGIGLSRESIKILLKG